MNKVKQIANEIAKSFVWIANHFSYIAKKLKIGLL
jgi:hypothetical protein